MKKARERRESVSNSGVASAIKGNTNNVAPEDEFNAETDGRIDSDYCSFDGTESDSSDSSDSRDLDGEDDHADEVVGKRPSFGDASSRSNMTDENWDAKDLFHASVFQTKKIWAMAKMLHTMKDTIRFIEENIDISIESKTTRLSNADKKKSERILERR